ncbi:hypothetical protein [Nonomuraea sp. NPDC050643]|uniref:hypothetical protein n=1 Tax=Nonomuraea sp. NPDC050643 TaxID=3155660 RepID=UPI0033FC3C70
MVTIVVIVAPLVALIIWGIVFDLRRRRSPLSAHDIEAQARRAREATDARGGSGSAADSGGHAGV